LTLTPIRDELKAYQSDLVERPEVVALTKVEGLDEEIIADLTAQLRRVVDKDTPIFAISSQAGTGLRDMLYAVKDRVTQERARRAEEQPEEETIPVLRLTNTEDAYTVTKMGNGFVVTGERIERFARRTDFESDEGVQRLRDIMQRAGIMHELVRKGIEPEQPIFFGSDHGDNMPY
jgi:GTPase